MDYELIFQNGKLVWAHNGTDFVMPRHVAVKVGFHAKGFNKTIGRTIDGSKKRFWFGKDRAEAQRKAAHVLNVWELIVQRDGKDAAWDKLALARVNGGVHIDKLLKLQDQVDEATCSTSSDSISLELVRVNNHKQSEPISIEVSDPEKAITLYDAIDAYTAIIKGSSKSGGYQRRRL